MAQVINDFSGANYFLSNFYPAPAVLGEWSYPTAEHAFAAAKTLDLTQRHEIRFLPSPALAKKYGRRVALREDWDLLRDVFMAKILASKFSYKPLAEKLLATGDAVLIEGNSWHDNYWGDCHCKKCKHTPGQNHLGVQLMMLRAQIACVRDYTLVH